MAACPNMILDDGRRRHHVRCHLGIAGRERRRGLPSTRPTSEEEGNLSSRLFKEDARPRSPRAGSPASPRAFKGVSEETNHGAWHRLYGHGEGGQAPVSQPSTSTTPSPSRSSTTLYGCREEPRRRPIPPRHRRDDGRQGGRWSLASAIVGKGFGPPRLRQARFGRVNGCRRSTRSGALQAAMEGLRGSRPWRTPRRAADIFVTAEPATRDVLTVEHMPRHEGPRPSSANIGHFDNEIEVAGLKNFKWHNVKPAGSTRSSSPGGKRIILLSEGRLVNLGQCDGPSLLRHVGLLHQTRRWAPGRAVRQARGKYEKEGLHAAQASR